MRKEYDFTGAVKNPYAARLKRPVTIRLDVATIAYFRRLADAQGDDVLDALHNVKKIADARARNVAHGRVRLQLGRQEGVALERVLLDVRPHLVRDLVAIVDEPRHQDLGIEGQGAGEGQELLLTDRKPGAPFLHRGVELRIAVRVCLADRPLHRHTIALDELRIA